METKIRKLYIQDSAVVCFAMIILWAILAFMMFSVRSIAPNNMVKAIIITAGIMVGIFASASSIAVLVHLNKNKQELYLQELLCRKKN